MLEEDRAAAVERYRSRYRQFGYDPRSLGWNKGRQSVRFAAVVDAIGMEFASVLDVGCGFGDLFGYLTERGWRGSYLGVDICPELLEEGARRFGSRGARFECVDLSSEPVSYSAEVAVAIGVFNHRLKEDNLEFAERMLHAMWAHSTQVIAADFLSTAADRPRPELFHAEPDSVLRLALGYSRRVRLEHSYMPFEFLVAIWHDDSFSAEVPVFDHYLKHIAGRPT